MRSPLSLFRACGWLALVLFTSFFHAARDVQAAPTAENCFPFGYARFHGLAPPDASRNDWWCPSHMQYGFMG